MLTLINDSISEFLDKQDEKKVSAKVTAKVTVNQQKIINALKDNPFVTQAELSKIVGITEKNIKSNMKKLQQNHLISRIGADKNGRWEVIND